MTDKSIIVWQLTRDDSEYGFPKKILKGHNHFVSDVVISSDGECSTPVCLLTTPHGHLG